MVAALDDALTQMHELRGAPELSLAQAVRRLSPCDLVLVEGFKAAAHVFEETLALHRGAAMTLETRAVLASYDAAGDMLTVWSATQTPHLCRGTLADLLDRQARLGVSLLINWSFGS